MSSVEPPGKHRSRDQWGPREVIALVIIFLAFVMGAIAQITGEPEASVPAWVAALVGGVSLFLYKNGGDKNA